ncbi:MAG TPA: hypothetical protein PLI96_01450 [Halothiobacillus sp.]|nr:hypothetical protein [Halothiobacillus sp.]
MTHIVARLAQPAAVCVAWLGLAWLADLPTSVISRAWVSKL